MKPAPEQRPRTTTPADGAPAPTVGDMLGAYHLDAVAGEGGMGRVFRATHTKLDKRVAVKVLRRRYSRRPEAINRFFQEARAVNVIRHPNIVEITDFVEGPPGGDSYYIMEWLDGTTLAARLAKDRVLPVEMVVSIGRQVASALGSVHKAGFVHRDLKPENVFLCTRDGRVSAKILDFGVAMLQGPTDGAMAGTPAYFSPEGAAGRALDGRSDIYSLGVMLYELLAGAPPFAASSMSEYVMKHMTARPRPLLEVALNPLPPSLVAAVERCLEKDPDRRFQTMDELEAALAALKDEAPARPHRFPTRALIVAAFATVLTSAAVTRAVRAVTSVGAPGAAGPSAPVATAPPTSGAQPAAAPSASATVTHPPVAAAPSNTVGVRIDSDPQGAEVYRRGVMLGTTPCTIQLPPGPQSLVIAKVGSRKLTIPIDAREGTAFSARLSPVRAGKVPRPSREGSPQGDHPLNETTTINPFD